MTEKMNDMDNKEGKGYNKKMGLEENNSRKLECRRVPKGAV